MAHRRLENWPAERHFQLAKRLSGRLGSPWRELEVGRYKDVGRLALPALCALALVALPATAAAEVAAPAEAICIVGGFGFTGTTGPDSYQGTIFDDIASAGNSGDFMSGGGGNDTLCGESGNDAVRGGGGNDKLVGGTGNDVMGLPVTGNQLGDSAGNDLLWGGIGADTLLEPADTGQVCFVGITCGLLQSLRYATKDVLAGGDGDDVLQDFNGGDDDLFGGPGNDTLRSGADANFAQPDTVGSHQDFFGGTGDDTIEDRNGGDDNLRGESGNDTLRGGPGRDLVQGGSGNDVLDPDACFGCALTVPIAVAADQALGGDDDDTLLIRDGSADTFNCGAGFDRVEADPQDIPLLFTGQSFQPIGSLTTNIDIALQGLRIASCESSFIGHAHEWTYLKLPRRLHATRTGRVSVRLACPPKIPERCSGKVRFGRVTVAPTTPKGSFDLAPGEAVSVRLFLPRKERRQVGRHGRGRVRVTIFAQGHHGPKLTISTLRVALTHSAGKKAA
jgi:RTX calcium-binding nonapeptide repeat (4 copies)